MQPEVEQPKKKELTPIEQWDMLAFKVIGNELVPRGFKTQKNGKYRGTEYAEVPKNAVVRTQKIAAQLVRGYRDKMKTKLNADKQILESDLKKCRWWQFKKQITTMTKITVINEAIINLNTVDIK